MGMSRAKQLQVKILEQELEKLGEDFRAVADKKLYESNPQEKNNLELQLQSIFKEIDKVEQALKDLKQGETGTEIQSLLAILSCVDNQVMERIKAAYLVCRPSGWEDYRPDIPNTIKEILADLEDMPQGDSGYKRTFQFVARLVVDSQMPYLLRQQLKNWLQPKVDNLSKLLNQTKQPTHPEHFYLMVWIQPSQQKSDRYFVKAWLAFAKQPDEIESEYEYEPLSISDTEGEAFTLAQIPQLLKEILIQSSNKCALSDLTIEFFLPRHLLNDEFDRWEIEISEDFFVPIGVECSVAVRSQERLLPNYCLRKNDWKKKWKKLKQLNHGSSSNVFASGDCVWNELYIELKREDIVGCKLSKSPSLLGKESVFNVILGTATPLALWLRGNLVHLNCQTELNQLLNCCITELPTTVKQKRCAAFSSHPRVRQFHIGSHLSLLWEDPYRLPPMINYSTPSL